MHAGKELYYTSVGEFDPATAGGPAITGRMSNNGWGSCGSCHPFGLSDNVVWIFPSGPKRTIPQHTDFDQTDPARKTLRALNWSAERDEEADFELNIRVVSGGLGLIVGADGVTQEPNVANFTPLASSGRNQLKVRGVPAWDAIEAYVQTGIRAPDLSAAQLHRSRHRRRTPALHPGQLPELPRRRAVDLQPRALQPAARREPDLQHAVDRRTAQRGHLQSAGLQRGSPERRSAARRRRVRSSLAALAVRIPADLLPQRLGQLARRGHAERGAPLRRHARNRHPAGRRQAAAAGQVPALDRRRYCAHRSQRGHHAVGHLGGREHRREARAGQPWLGLRHRTRRANRIRVRHHHFQSHSAAAPSRYRIPPACFAWDRCSWPRPDRSTS